MKMLLTRTLGILVSGFKRSSLVLASEILCLSHIYGPVGFHGGFCHSLFGVSVAC